VREAADRVAVLVRLAFQEGDVTQRVGGFLDGKVVPVRRAAARLFARMRLDERVPVVETHQGAIGARAQLLADEARRQRVQCLVHLRVLVARDLRLAPQRHVVRFRRRRQELRLLLGVEVFERHALRARVTAHAVLGEAPVTGVRARLLDVVDVLAAEAVVAHRLHCALDSRLVLRTPHTCRVDDEAALLRVFEKRRVDERRQRVRRLHDRLRVVGDQRLEDAAEELPCSLACLDRALCGLTQARPHETMPRAHRGEDPRSRAAALAVGPGLQPQHPAGVELHFLAGPAVGDRDGRRRAPEAQLGDREAVQRRVRHLDALAQKEPPHLRQLHVCAHLLVDEHPLLDAAGPAVAVRSSGRRSQLDRQLHHALVGERGLARQPAARRAGDVPPDRLAVQPQLLGDARLRHASQPQPDRLFDLHHRDLAVRHRRRLAPSVLLVTRRGGGE